MAGLPDEQVVRWGDPIGSHGADVISVNRRTGEVTLWDAKYRASSARIQHSPTFREDVPIRSNRPTPRQNALKQAEETLETDTSLPKPIRERALANVRTNRVRTRTVGFGAARNSTFGN